MFHYDHDVWLETFLASKTIGGRRGIRTLGTLARTLVFETSTINHSVTRPRIFLIPQNRGVKAP